MTIQSQTTRVDYTGNGATTNFPVPFYWLQDADLLVIRTDNAYTPPTVATLALGTDYAVIGSGNQSGGSITTTVAPTATQKLSILRNVPFTQLTHYVPNDPFPAASHEQALDKLTMETQQLNEGLSRSITLPPNATGLSTNLPLPAANNLIGWNPAANALQNVDPTTIATSVTYGNAVADKFSGDGSTVNFNLSANPGGINNLDVSISGVTQRPGIDYTWVAGTTLTFTVAPPVGTNNILARYAQALPIGSLGVGQVTASNLAAGAVTDTAVAGNAAIQATKLAFTQSGVGAVTRSVQSKLAETVSAKDFGAVGDGSTDDTVALQALVTYINSIANTDGRPVTAFFPPGLYKYSTTLKFTRPVALVGNQSAYLYYTAASGNAVQLGPDGLSGYTETQKYYSVNGLGLQGGTTTGYGYYVAPWVLYPSFDRIRINVFGGDGSWAIFCQYNNWSIYVRDCEFWGKTIAGDTAKRNFFKAAGVALDGVTTDGWASRANVVDCWVYSGGNSAGGIALWLTGWKSRMQGGGIEGPYIGIVVGAGANDIELNGVYYEAIFADAAGPRFLQFSAASGDPYWPTYNTIKRLKLCNVYANMHNTDALASNGVFTYFAQNIQLQDPDVDGLTLVHSGSPIFNFPEIQGHKGVNYRRIKTDGNVGAGTFLFETQYANQYKPGYDLVAHNYVRAPDFSTIATGFTSTAAPINTNFGTSYLTMLSDGTGGSYSGTKVASDNTSGTAYERYRIDQQLNYGLFQCTSAASSQTYCQVLFDLDASLIELQNEVCVLSFWAKAYNNPVTLTATHQYLNAGIQTAFDNSQIVTTAYWARYAMRVTLSSIPLGTSITAGTIQRVTINFPVAAVFAVALAGVVFTKGGIAAPLAACAR